MATARAVGKRPTLGERLAGQAVTIREQTQELDRLRDRLAVLAAERQRAQSRCDRGGVPPGELEWRIAWLVDQRAGLLTEATRRATPADEPAQTWSTLLWRLLWG